MNAFLKNDNFMMNELQVNSTEEKICIATALIAALRWYAVCDNKRKNDDTHAVVLINLLEELQQV
jgi:hypothetical protein